MACRSNRQRVWTHRIMLEAMCHGENSFLTLTYADEYLPRTGSLEPLHFTGFLKRLRKQIEPRKIRYYAVGEYGGLSFRPHYHAALFGLACLGSGDAVADMVARRGCSCSNCSVVRKAWGFGHVFLGRLERKSAQYIARYVLKKMTHREDPRLQGRHPEFSRMSLRPWGLGASVMADASRVLLSIMHKKKLTDVPLTLRLSQQQYPLGRYLRTQLRKRVFGSGEARVPWKSEELQAVRAYAWSSGKSVSQVYEELFGVSDEPVMDRGTL